MENPYDISVIALQTLSLTKIRTLTMHACMQCTNVYIINTVILGVERKVFHVV